ncbi:MAG: esterase family protein [Mucilaginibacter sp.]|nr:esterase family protein [Mucilaginibacter sp.]
MLSKLFKKLSLVFVCIMLVCLHANAAKVDTVVTRSNSMNRDIKAVVIRPDNYNKKEKYPVLYLLHGFSGNYSDWVKKAPDVVPLADQYHCLIVCPDGNFASWYFDSPLSNEWKYETYVASELVSWIDRHYSTIANRTGRAITGLSMGGHGALYLAIRHQDTYAAAGSMSGCVDLVPFSKSFDISQVLGDYESNQQRWKDNSVINMLDQIKPNSLAIIFDCGYSDGFYPSNMEMHNRLVQMKIPHDFIVRDGGHSWEYWGNSIVYQMLFFSRHLPGWEVKKSQ